MMKRKTLRREQFIRLTAVLVILSLCTLAILKVENMLIAFVLAFVINYLLNPFVNSLERSGMARSLAVGVIYAAVGAAFALCLYCIFPRISGQLSALQSDLPKYYQGISILANQFDNVLPPFVRSVLPQLSISRMAGDGITAFSDRFFSDLPGLLSTTVTTAILAPLFAFFMLADGQTAIKKLLSIIPNNLFEISLNLLYQINLQIGGFIRARLLEAAIVGLIVWCGLLLIDAPYAPFMGIFAGLTNLVPYIGPVIGAIPAIMISLINGGTDATLWMIVSVYTIAQLIDSVVIIPLVVAKIVNLHAIIVIVVIILGAQLGGILGMIISIPIASIIKLTAETVYFHLIDFRT